MTKLQPSALCAVALSAGPLFAHVTLAEPSARAGAYHAAFFRLSHGCADSPTLALRIEIPPSVMVARPQPKPGWTLAVEHAPLPAPVRGEGGQLVRDRVSAITWTGRLEPDEFDQFGVMLRLPDAPGPLAFPARQHCATGDVNWNEVAAGDGPPRRMEHPAPVLTVTAGAPAPTHDMPM